uniref:Putative group viii salivary lipocalin lipocalin n=1 Tax=Hyalomma excavatum TaxID=257692 RepID=A0A131XL01_9ACAR
MPIYSQNKWYLVAYTVGLNTSGYKCVESTFKSRNGSFVRRILSLQYKKDRRWATKTIPLNLRIDPCSVLLDVCVSTDLYVWTKAKGQYQLLYYDWNSFVLSDVLQWPLDDLQEWTGANSQYQLLYYSWNSMILSDVLKTPLDKPSCTLWVKARYLDEVKRTATMDYFNVLCKEPLYIGYPSDCPK